MPSYKLTYFDARGRAEVSRLIFAAAGVEYTDERVKDWPAGKDHSPLGQLPYLTIDGNTKMPQSITIARFLAKKFNLAGGNDLANAQCDVVVDTISDLAQAYYQKVFFLPKEQQAEAGKKFMAEDAPKHLTNIEKLVTLYGSNGHSVGNSVTWADLHMFDVTGILHSKDAHALEKFPHILKVRQTVESHPKVAAWLKARPESPF